MIPFVVWQWLRLPFKHVQCFNRLINLNLNFFFQDCHSSFEEYFGSFCASCKSKWTIVIVTIIVVVVVIIVSFELNLSLLNGILLSDVTMINEIFLDSLCPRSEILWTKFIRFCQTHRLTFERPLSIWNLFVFVFSSTWPFRRTFGRCASRREKVIWLMLFHFLHFFERS